MRAAALSLALLVVPAVAHEVGVSQSGAPAAVLTLRYADGQPFAYEAYELYRPDGGVPLQVGRTDAQGRVVFVADGRPVWRLKAYSADGHGVDREIRVDAAALAAPAPGNAVAAGVPRGWLLAAGCGVIFGLFGLFQLFITRGRE